MKALAARDAGVPFYVAAPSFQHRLDPRRGPGHPIEERDPEEVTHIGSVRVAPTGSAVRNFGFDVTPAELVTGLITERGVCKAFPSRARRSFPRGPTRRGGQNR